MRRLPKIDLQPTFPLDEKELKRRVGIRRWFRPETWVVLAPTGLILALADLPPLPAVGLLAGAAGILFLTWDNFKKPLEAAAIAEMVAQSNDKQDQEIARYIRGYHAAGQYAYAKALGRFALLKRHIEEKLATDEELTMDPVEVETLVDNICREICLKFNAAARLDADLAQALTSPDRQALPNVVQQRREILEPVRDAYATLWETYENLMALKDLDNADELIAEIADAASHPESTVDLDQLISELREENQVAKGIRKRVRTHPEGMSMESFLAESSDDETMEDTSPSTSDSSALPRERESQS